MGSKITTTFLILPRNLISITLMLTLITLIRVPEPLS